MLWESLGQDKAGITCDFIKAAVDQKVKKLYPQMFVFWSIFKIFFLWGEKKQHKTVQTAKAEDFDTEVHAD